MKIKPGLAVRIFGMALLLATGGLAQAATDHGGGHGADPHWTYDGEG